MGAYDHQGISAIAERRKTRPVRVGAVQIGGGAPIVVQSMTTTDTRDAAGTIAQVRALAEAGADVVRLAVPDADAAAALSEIVRQLQHPPRRRHPLRLPARPGRDRRGHALHPAQSGQHRVAGAGP